jgi:hypothetical protein
MKYLLLTIACCSLLLGTTQAQESYVRFGLHSIYLPQFTVQEASDVHVRPLGIRLMLSDYNMAPIEFGFNAYTKYGDTAHVSFGTSLAYLFAERKGHDFKVGINVSKIDLEDIHVNKLQIGPQVGDVRFQGFGNELKPYVEWEWMGTRFASLFVQMGYRIINGEKTVVTSVEKIYDPELDITRTVLKERDWSFFYSASGFEIGVGLTIPILM